MGKGKDKDNKRGGPKQFAESSDQIETRKPKKKGKAAFEESSEEEESDGEVVPVRGGQQNANAGMMPPSDDEEEETDDDDEEEEEAQKGPAATPAEMMAFIKSKGLEGELKAWLKSRAAAAKPGKPMPGYELSKAEAAKKKQEEEEESSDEEPDPAVLKKLEEVKKRREEQKAKRIAADGWDRMMPMTADNHPPGMTWPPPDQA